MLSSLIVAVCGFSAWSVGNGIVPLADGDEVTTMDALLDQCYPAENETVKELTDVLITFPENETDIQVNPNFTGSYLAMFGSVTTDGKVTVKQRVSADQTNRFDKILNGKEVASNQIVCHLASPLTSTTSEQWCITIYVDALVSGTTGHLNSRIRYFYIMDPSYKPEPEPGPAPSVETFDYGFSYASFGIDNNYDYTYEDASNVFDTNVTFLDLPSGVTVDESKNPVKWIRQSDGAEVAIDVTYFMSSWMIFTMQAEWPTDPFGVWTCTLPQGLFLSGENQSVEKVLKVTWIDPNAANPKPEFEVTRVSFFNTPDCFSNKEGKPAGVPKDMMYTLWKTVDGGEDMMNWQTDPKTIANLNSNKGFVFNTTWDDYIVCFVAEVKRKDGQGEIDVWNQETRQEIYGYGEVCKNYVGSSATNCVPYQHPLLGCGGNVDTREYWSDSEYTFDIYFYDSMMNLAIDDSNHSKACGSYHFEFTGATTPFEYSTIAKLVSISPAPINGTALGLEEETPGVLTKVSDPIIFTWSAPVTMKAQYSQGSGTGLANVQSCTSNADKTVWTVVPGASCISNGEGGYLNEFEFDVTAIDAEGHYVKGNIGEKTNTMFIPIFNFDVNSGITAADQYELNIVSQNRSILVNGLTERVNVVLYNLSGMKLGEVADAESSAEFSNIVPGIYMVVIKGNNGTQTFKILHN